MENKKNSSSLKRHVAAAVALPLFVAYVYCLPPFPYFLALVVIGGMAAMRELFVMYRVPLALNITGVIAGGILLYVFCIYPDYALYGIFSAVCLVVMLRLFSSRTPSGSMSETGPVGIGFLYIAGCLSFQWFLRNVHGTDGLKYIFMLYMSVWFADSLAYYVGTYIGKRKLCPSISPKKTVEGAFGSILGGILGVMAAKVLFDIPGLSLYRVSATGAIMGLTALTGDLIESMYKRDAGVKDSGSLMPGHGGIFDRIDGMLVSGPVLYFIVRYF